MTEEVTKVVLADLDAAGAVALLEQAVELRGADYIYHNPGDPEEGPSCRYSHGTEPGCIVGVALHLAGVSLAGLNKADCDSLGCGAASPHALELFGYSAEVGSVFREAQVVQDKGESWGTAVEAARWAAGFIQEDQGGE